ncbi:MAG: hypothetical protein KJO55_09535 [Gammaproteobacteria bacterium]|nr:hypothetical protein [Gammaproteobacteria bacterium]NND61192.1 hypothetical protein [Gammaproteobacteria bacterium]
MKLRNALVLLLLLPFMAQAQVINQCTNGSDPNYCDTDDDGFGDNEDNCTLVANPAQRDTDGDHFGNMCDPDLDNDGAVNFTDLTIMKGAFFSTGDTDTDLNGDGITNFVDLTIMKASFFGTPGPTATDPEQPPCNCYFSGDCAAGSFCDYGPGGFTVEDICVWRGEKPEGTPDWGCSFEVNAGTGGWPPGVCDGRCVSATEGSFIGFENQALIGQTLNVWAQAMIEPSAAGGGPVDSQLANVATAIQFEGQGVPLMLGRHAADALAMAAGEPFHLYFCHYEGHPEDLDPPVVNLAGDSCRIEAGYLTVQALAAEIEEPGAAPAIMAGIVDICPDWQNMFGTQCDAGPDALKCATNFVQAQAHFLRTPRLDALDPLQLLRAASH